MCSKMMQIYRYIDYLKTDRINMISHALLQTFKYHLISKRYCKANFGLNIAIKYNVSRCTLMIPDLFRFSNPNLGSRKPERKGSIMRSTFTFVGLLFLSMLIIGSLPVESSSFELTPVSFNPSPFTELNESLEIPAIDAEYGTGSISLSLGPVYQYSGTDIRVGMDVDNIYYHSYAKFDLAGIPPGSTIEAVELTVYTSAVTDDENHSVLITSLLLDPSENSAEEVWNNEYIEYIGAVVPVMNTHGVHNIELNEDAVADLQSVIDAGGTFWGVRFREGLNIVRTGVIAGNETEHSPYCTITLQSSMSSPSDFFIEYIPDADAMVLSWVDNSEDETHFRINRRFQRNPDDDPDREELDWTEWSEAVTVPENVNVYIDTTINTEGTYQYRIRAENEDECSVWAFAEADYLNVRDIGISGIPASTRLNPNYPNPFNSQTTVNFQLHKTGLVKMRLYDITGRQVSEIINGFYSPGIYHHQIDLGHIANGMYFIRMNTAGSEYIRKITFIK